MVRLALTSLALSMVAGQLCNMQYDCGGCVGTSGCVWKGSACWAASSYPFCSSDADCYQLGSICPISAYASASVFPATTTVSDASLPVMAYGAPLYASPAVTAYASAPIYSYPSAPVYSYPSAPVYGYPSAPMYGPPPYYYGGGYWNGGWNNGNNGNNGLFDFSGNVVGNTIRNNIYANALDPLIPGIGGAVTVGNNVNLLANSPRFINGVVGGNGYNRNPFGTYVRNDYYANALGGFFPGVSGALSTLNQYNLYSSLLG